ncbi:MULTISPECIES: hypothetical protein [Bradyrhizobium]|uniref:hypothetical protein n=1 Tax=Bradyrhizobium elkanii TaxID=29448 RepID=UPI00068644AC|nr:hypothetical protein [Bradyrhizobium elkanii]
MRQGKGQIRQSFHVCGGVLAISIMLGAGVGYAQDGTSAQRNACKPDVFRLCAEFIPNRDTITACLQRKVSKLSPACRAVFEGKK